MKAKRTRRAVFPIIMGSLALGLAVVSLNAVNASIEEEVKKESNILTAQQIVDRVKLHVTCPWQERTVDTFKAGDPDAPVTGVAVTFLTTYDVLRRAAQQGCNLVITHEPTFYHGRDDVEVLVAGETREWETVKYVRFVNEVQIKFIPAGDPFWTP